jgi:ketosteroid isomerase-like protein
MKRLLTVISMFCALQLAAQDKHEKEIIARTYLLSHTVFGTKDSATLERLFAKRLSYGHSKGKIENRQEAIHGISGNTSVYSDTAVTGIVVTRSAKTAIVRYLFKAKENKKDGTVVPLNFTMILVWVKEKGAWRLMARQAVALPQ